MARSVAHPEQIAFLVGKPLHRTSLLAEIVERLHHTCPTIALHRLDHSGVIPDWLRRSNLVVQRGLPLPALQTASQLENTGVRCCNPIAASCASHDRAAVIRMLSQSGVAVPESSVITSWRELLDVSDRRPIVVKTVDGGTGRGVNVLIAADGILPHAPPFAGPYLAQAYIDHDFTVSKLYVVGHRLQGLIKKHQASPGVDESGIPFDVDQELSGLAQRVGEVSGLEIFGVDVLFGNDGPCVIDVNAFPGFRGVEGSARLIADYLHEISPVSG